MLSKSFPNNRNRTPLNKEQNEWRMLTRYLAIVVYLRKENQDVGVMLSPRGILNTHLVQLWFLVCVFSLSYEEYCV